MKRSLALLWRLWTKEGTASIRDRAWDHWRDARRRAALRPVSGGLAGLAREARADVLQLSAAPPAPWWGGVQAQLLDRIRAQRQLAPVALLHGEGRRLVLEVSPPGTGGFRVDLGVPMPPPLALADVDFERVVGEALTTLGARVLHVESAHQLPLASLTALARAGARLVLSIHDFTLFCPRPNLLEVPAGRFCNYCTDPTRCGRCLRVDWALDDDSQARRRAAAEELLATCAHVIYPSPFLRDLHGRLFAARPPSEVIAPAVAISAGASPRRAPAEAGRPPLVAFLGGGSLHKGSAIFRDVVVEWSRKVRRPLRWRVYGGGGELLPELRRVPGVEVRGYYRHGSLASLLRRDGAQLVLLLSVVPESYSLALDECAVAGVPAIAFRHGAVGERLARAGGMLVDADAGAPGVVEAIARWLDGASRAGIEEGLEVASPASAARRCQQLYAATAGRNPRASSEGGRGADAFSYPPHPIDRLRNAAGGIEWAARGLARRVRWPKGSRSLRELARRGKAIEHQADEALEAEPIVYLPALSWAFRFQRPQQLARALGAAGHQVLYCEAFRRTRILPARLLQPPIGNVYPLQLAVPGRLDPYREPPPASIAHELAERIAEGLVDRPRFVLAQLPFWGPVALRLARLLRVPLLYDRLDFHLGFPGIPPEIGELERRLIAAADLVLASSAVLLEDAAGQARRVALLPNAVAFEDFPEAAVRVPPTPRCVGYVGALGEWFDAGSVRRIAEERPDWSILLAGRVEDERVGALRKMPNVELLGEIPYSALPSFFGRLHLLLIPFLDLPLTRAVDPVKLYEALAAGLPVVSQALPAVERWREPLVYTYRGEPDVGLLEKALGEDSAELRARRRQAVARETWHARAAQVLDAVTLLH